MGGRTDGQRRLGELGCWFLAGRFVVSSVKITILNVAQIQRRRGARRCRGNDRSPTPRWTYDLIKIVAGGNGYANPSRTPGYTPDLWVHTTPGRCRV